MKITLYKGYHSDQALQAFFSAWTQNDLILFLPPTLDQYDFVHHLPKGELELKGELWTGQESLPTPKGAQQNWVAGVFSSGTTQTPRLILYSKNNIESSVRGIFELFDREKLQNLFCYPQPFHTFGLTLGYGAAVVLGLELRYPKGRYSLSHHQEWLEQVNDRTLTLGTPTHFYDLIQITQENREIPPSYSCIIGGAKVKKQLWFDCRDRLKIQEPSIGYGASEASPGITHLPPGVAPQEDGEIGIPLDHVSVSIGSSGLTFSGPNLCAALVEDGQLEIPQTFYLPDIVQVRETDQHWVYQTRSNWFLNRGGEKFSLEGIENWLKQDLGIETLCVGLPDPRLGEDLGILVLANRNQELKQQIFSCLKKKTQRDFNEKGLHFVEAFPLNENLKKDRIQARQWIARQMDL